MATTNDGAKWTQGQRLRAWLAHCGLTQTELAALLNISNRQVNKWATDRQVMRRSTLVRLTETLGIPLDEYETTAPPPKLEDTGFSDRLVQAMFAEGITQNALAAKLGLHRSTVGRWVHGERLPDEAMVQRIARHLHTSEAFLLRGERVTTPVRRVTLADFLQRRPDLDVQYVGLLYAMFGGERNLPAHCQCESFFEGVLRLVKETERLHAREKQPS